MRIVAGGTNEAGRSNERKKGNLAENKNGNRGNDVDVDTNGNATECIMR